MKATKYVDFNINIIEVTYLHMCRNCYKTQLVNSRYRLSSKVVLVNCPITFLLKRKVKLDE